MAKNKLELLKEVYNDTPLMVNIAMFKDTIVILSSQVIPEDDFKKLLPRTETEIVQH